MAFAPFESQGKLGVSLPLAAAKQFFRLASSGTNPPPVPFPQLTITAPVADFGTVLRTNTSTLNLAGTVSDPSAVVLVQGSPAVLSGTNWTANGVGLGQEGNNFIVITATSTGGAQTVASLVVNRDTTVLQPQGLQIRPLSAGTNEVDWLASGEADLSLTRIYRRPASGANQLLIGIALAPLTFFVDTNVAPGSNYCYQIQALDNLGNQSPLSAEVCPSLFGGVAGDLSRTGGSEDPANETSSQIAPTALVPPTPIAETNGNVRVRYVALANFFGDGISPNEYSRYGYGFNYAGADFEYDGPKSVHWDPAFMTSKVVTGGVLVEHSTGFGATLNVTLNAPPGWVFSGAGASPYFFAWGRYPQYGPAFPTPTNGPNWDVTQSLTAMPDVQYSTNLTFNITSNQVSFSVTSAGVAIDYDVHGNPVNSGPGNVTDFGITWNLNPVDPLLLAATRAPKVEINVNGTLVEAGLYLLEDSDPVSRAALTRPIDDEGGAVNLYSGDYFFQVPLFRGRGVGLNVEGLLEYSSVNASWDQAALQQAHPTNYTYAPLGPGWSYPYGMRILPHDLTVWNHGVAVRTNDVLLLVCPDGRVTQWWFDVPTQQFLSLSTDASIWAPSRVHSPAPAWAQFFGPVITRSASGYSLKEAYPATYGFQEIDFDSLGRMTNILYSGGVQPAAIAYVGAVQKVTDSSGRIAEFHFDGSGKMVEAKDPAGGDWLFNYSPGGALVGILEAGSAYGWEFAYDNTSYLLTERKLPHGFIIQAGYDTAADSTGRFFWGALKSTRWKETPATSTRTLTYQRNNVDSSTTNFSRVTIATPSGRNTRYFDIANVFLLSEHFAFGIGASVRVSDQLEGNPAALRYIGTDGSGFFFYFPGETRFEGHTNALGDTVTEYDYGPFPIYITREDGRSYYWNRTDPSLTMQAPSGDIGWRTDITNRYAYLNQGTALERLSAVYPPGQDPANAASRKVTYAYDASYRVQSITDMDSNVTQFVYHTVAGKTGLPFELIPAYNLIPPVTTGQTNPYAWMFDYDGLGRLTMSQDPNQNVTRYVYDGAGRLVQTTGPTNALGNFVGPETDYTYQGDLLIKAATRTIAGEWQTTTYVYDNQRRLLERSTPGNDPAGGLSSTKYAYDADGNVTNAIDPNGGSTSFQYDNRSRLTMALGPEGETTRYTFDDNTDEILEVTRSDGAAMRTWTVVSRDKLRQPVDVLLPTVTQGGFTARPELTFGLNPDGMVTSRVYSFAGQSSTVTKAFGLFDEAIQTLTDMGGGQSAYRFTSTDYAGRTKQAQGLALALTGGGGPSYIQPQPNRTHPTAVNMSYSPFDTISNVTDLFGNERANFTTDTSGLLSQINVPNPAIPHFGAPVRADTLAAGVTRDNFSAISGVADVFGNTDTFSRDAAGRVQSSTDPIGTQSQTSWSPAGDPGTVSTVAGGTTLDATRSLHDDLGNATQIVGPGNNGAGTVFQYDRSGRMTNSTDAAGHSTSFQYDAFGEVVRITYPSGNYITYVRDALGRPTSSTEHAANGASLRTETTEYDWLGRVGAVEDSNYRMEYDLDNLGRVLARRTIFKPMAVTNSLTYRFGEYGDLVSVQDESGLVTRFAWDDDDNLTNIMVVPPAGPVQDAAFFPDRTGQLTGWAFQSGGQPVVNAALGRDQKGRPTSLSYASSGTSLVPLPSFGYAYDARDLLTNITDYSKGLSAQLGYDPRGYLQSETWRQLADGTPIYQDQLGYDPAGNRAWRKLNGNITTYSYAADYRLQGQNQQTLVRVPAALIQTRSDSTNGPGFDPHLADNGLSPDSDAAGAGWGSGTNAADHWLEFDLGATYLISSVQVSVPTVRGGLAEFFIEISNSLHTSFQIVAPYQLVGGYRVGTNGMGTGGHVAQVTFASPQTASALRILVPKGGSGRNPLTQVQLPDVVINEVALYQVSVSNFNLAYDPDGRLTNDGTFAYSYDVQGRLTGVVGPGVDKSWTITPEGLRGSERNNLTGDTSYFANDGPNVYEEFTIVGGVPVTRLKYLNGPGADTHLGFYEYSNGSNAQFRWFLTQAQGGVSQVVDTQGNVLDDRQYTAWGEDLTTPTRSSANPYGFAGALQDAETGLYYNRARMYDPRVGRFLANDPAGMVDGVNLYLYAGNDPVNGADPSGLDYKDWFGLDGRESTIWAALKGAVEGADDGAVILHNAFKLGLDENLSREANRRAQQYGAWGTVMKGTAGISAGATYLAGGLYGAARLGLTGVGEVALTTENIGAGISTVGTALRTTASTAYRVARTPGGVSTAIFNAYLRANDWWNNLHPWDRAAGEIGGQYFFGFSPSGDLHLGAVPTARRAPRLSDPGEELAVVALVGRADGAVTGEELERRLTVTKSAAAIAELRGDRLVKIKVGSTDLHVVDAGSTLTVVGHGSDATVAGITPAELVPILSKAGLLNSNVKRVEIVSCRASWFCQQMANSTFKPTRGVRSSDLTVNALGGITRGVPQASVFGGFDAKMKAIRRLLAPGEGFATYLPILEVEDQ